MSEETDERLRQYYACTTRQEKADWLLRELAGHHSAEGWSQYLERALSAYDQEFGTELWT